MCTELPVMRSIFTRPFCTYFKKRIDRVAKVGYFPRCNGLFSVPAPPLRICERRGFLRLRRCLTSDCSLLPMLRQGQPGFLPTLGGSNHAFSRMCARAAVFLAAQHSR